MLTHISWTHYLLITGAFFFVYYVVLAVASYRKVLSHRFGHKTSPLRRPSPIPVSGGVMGSVLYDEQEEDRYYNQYAPVPQMPQQAAVLQPDDSEEINEDSDDEPIYEDEYEAHQAADWDIMQDLMDRLDDEIRKSPNSTTPAELVDQICMVPSSEEKEVLQKYQESVSLFLIERVAEKLHVRITETMLRPLWR